jgi:hypothetical protein
MLIQPNLLFHDKQAEDEIKLSNMLTFQQLYNTLAK